MDLFKYSYDKWRLRIKTRHTFKYNLTSDAVIHFEADNLGKLEFLVGRWKTTDFIYPGFVGPGGRGHGTVEFGWEMDRSWLAFELQTELPGAGDYMVNGRMGYNPQTGHYQTVSWNNMNRMYTYRGHWKEDNTLAYHLIYPKKSKNLWIYYQKISEHEIHKWLQMQRPDGEVTTGYEMIFTKTEKPKKRAPVSET